MSDIEVKLDGRYYEWSGGFGAILISQERRVIQGQVRVIQDILFYAYNVCGKTVWWSVIDSDAEKIREIKKKLLGLN